MARRAAAHPEPGLPGVNLLSPEAFEEAAVRLLRRRFVALVAVLVLLVAAASAAQHLRVRDARAAAEAEREGIADLTAQVAELQPVQAYLDGVRSQATVVRNTMLTEIYFSRVLDGLDEALPAGARLESLAVTLTPMTPEGMAEAAVGQGSSCPGPDPFNIVVAVGCATLSGRADSRAEVGRFVIALDRHQLFREPFITTTTTEDGKGLAFSGSVALGPEVFSLRYADLASELGLEPPSLPAGTPEDGTAQGAAGADAGQEAP